MQKVFHVLNSFSESWKEHCQKSIFCIVGTLMFEHFKEPRFLSTSKILQVPDVVVLLDAQIELSTLAVEGREVIWKENSECTTHCISEFLISFLDMSKSYLFVDIPSIVVPIQVGSNFSNKFRSEPCSLYPSHSLLALSVIVGLGDQRRVPILLSWSSPL